MVANPALDDDPRTRLLAELQHRVRNTLATTRFIARRSAETSESLEDYVAHLDGRLAALARVQNAVVRNPMAGIDLGLLVADETASAGQSIGAHVQIEGPALLLHPRAAEAFALALHELMTNAIKFGALSVPAGRLRISWDVETQDIETRTGAVRRLVFGWTETGMKLVMPHSPHQGFGTIVLRQMLTHNLGAATDLAFPSAGFRCRIAVPLTERVVG